MDHCCVWESHADPAVRRVRKPIPDLTYPAYVVGDADMTSGATRVAAVTGQRSGTNQQEDLLRRLLTTAESPAPPPEVPAVEKLLQRLVTETQSSTSGCEFSSTDRIRTDDVLFPRGSAPTTAAAAATATPRPARLERRSMFLGFMQQHDART